MFHVDKIGYEQLDDLIELWKRRYFWLKEKNLEMWKLDQLNAESIIRKYEYPQCFIAFEDKVSVGGFLLLEKDKRYWPDNLDGKAYYFHKFVVDVDSSGKGYSDKILEWVKKHGRINHKDYIRLDYEKQREYLRKMYLKNGFEDIEIMHAENGYDIVKAECRL
jgi:GNAT superfamily N-acetyltransferase